MFSAWYAHSAQRSRTTFVAVETNNLRRLLRTVEALSELGPELTAERDFAESSRRMLSAVMEAAGAREGALFLFNEKPTMLTSVSSIGFDMLPEPAFIPLLPKHAHALTAARQPIVLNASTYSVFLSSNGNVAPELFKCLAPLKAAGRLAGIVALGRRPGDAAYEDAELNAMELLCSYIGLAVQNHALTQTLAQRVTENLRLMASLHGFYDTALEAFATAIDVKHVNIHGHSLRVGRYAAAIGEAMGVEPSEVAALKSAGYLHDIGKVAVDRRLFSKPAALNPEEFREMADHTVVGHQIVSSVEFPWPKIHESVRWHHERCDGSGYPDALAGDEMPMPVRIMALADTFDAMTSPRPYRESLSLGGALSDLVRMSPMKYDPNVVQALLIQVRRDAVGSNRTPLVADHMTVNIAPTDIDQLAATLQHKISRGKMYLT
jgi:putative nucleotidyltransferase with HDIG domain